MARDTAEVIIELSNGKRAGDTINDLTGEAVKLNREIKKLKPGSEEFIKKTQDYQKVNKRLKDIRDEVRGVDKANNGLLDTLSQYIPFSGHFNQVKGSVNLLSMSFKTLRGAIISTGIGALIVLLGSLISYLTTTQSGMDKVTKITRPLKAIFQTLLGVIQQLGESGFNKIGEYIKDPMQAFKDLGDVILNNFLNRIKAVGQLGPAIMKIFSKDWKQGLLDLGNATAQFYTGIEDPITKLAQVGQQASEIIGGAIDAGTKLDQLQKAIEQKEIEQIKRSEQLKLIAKQQNDIAEDTSKTLQERERAAQAAIDAQVEREQMELDLINLKIEKMKLEQTLNDTSRDDLKELAQLEAEAFTKSTEIQEQRTTLRNKLNILRQQQTAAVKKAADEEAKAREEQAAREKAAAEKAAAERAEQLKKEEAARRNIQDLALQIMEDGQEKELAKIQLDTFRKIEALTGSAEQIREQKKLLEELEQKEIQEVRDKYAEQQAEKEKKRREEDLAKRQQYEDAKKQIQEAGYKAFDDVISGTIALLGAEEKSRKRNAQLIKSFETARVAVGLQAEIQAIWEYANKNPSNALFPGAAQAIAVVKTIAAVTRAGLAVNKINSTKFASGGFIGGLLKGASHAFGGIPAVVAGSGMPLELEGDEFVFSKKATRAIGVNKLSRINDHFTRTMATGGPINPMNAAGSGESLGSEGLQKLERLEAAFLTYAEKVDTWTRNIRVNNNLQEVRDGLTTLTRLESEVNL